jgi:3-deoxy-D-arabino-heptulosonate 7-phosphate (DAHP) synthase
MPDHDGHLLGSTEAAIVHLDHGDDTSNVGNKALVSSVEGLHVFQRDARLAITISHLDSSDRFLRSQIKVNNDIRLLHEVAHVAE